jgi:alkaline phosphatase D
MRRVLAGALASSALVLMSGAAQGVALEAPAVTHGVVVGDIESTSAVLWARADQDAFLNVRLSGGRHKPVPRVPALAAHDYTAQMPIDGLEPDTTYRYRAWFSLGAPGVGHGAAVLGSFRTAPADETIAPVRLAFGGDISGQNVCRDLSEGIPIANTIDRFRPDIFVGLGDMVYADNACDPIGRYGNAQVPGGFGPAVDLAGFWAHWRYNRADPALQRLLSSTNYVGIWDDH